MFTLHNVASVTPSRTSFYLPTMVILTIVTSNPVDVTGDSTDNEIKGRHVITTNSPIGSVQGVTDTHYQKLLNDLQLASNVVSSERLYAVYRPLHVKQFIIARRPLLFIAATFLLTACYHIYVPLQYTYYMSPGINGTKIVVVGYTDLYTGSKDIIDGFSSAGKFIFIFLPLVWISVFNVLVVCFLRRHSYDRRTIKSTADVETTSRRDRQMTLTILACTAGYVLFIVPGAIHFLALVVVPEYNFFGKEAKLVQLMDKAQDICLQVSYMSDFLMNLTIVTSNPVDVTRDSTDNEIQGRHVVTTNSPIGSVPGVTDSHFQELSNALQLAQNVVSIVKIAAFARKSMRDNATQRDFTPSPVRCTSNSSFSPAVLFSLSPPPSCSPYTFYLSPGINGTKIVVLGYTDWYFRNRDIVDGFSSAGKFIFIFVPLVWISVFNVLVVHFLRRHRDDRKAIKSTADVETTSRRDRQMTLTILACTAGRCIEVRNVPEALNTLVLTQWAQFREGMVLAHGDYSRKLRILHPPNPSHHPHPRSFSLSSGQPPLTISIRQMFFPNASNVLYRSCLFIACLMSSERLYAVYRPLHIKQFILTRRPLLFIAAIVLLTACYHVYYPIQYMYYLLPGINGTKIIVFGYTDWYFRNKDIVDGFSAAGKFFFIFLPLIWVSVSNVLVVRILRRHSYDRRTIKSTANEDAASSETVR
ncbi:hypothetical protein C0Q70_07454 [Pomacea canaliculata]|uniref:G-protein coupled receptors family 1 profile domain-containing protein n=1 Tax=Pomacea canaliculata TaxID=400727 RepID=A0A2T7PF31_POMCA|nr:hypothetical protein C0Q70_07454 [Pomacea canaliculata]